MSRVRSQDRSILYRAKGLNYTTSDSSWSFVSYGDDVNWINGERSTMIDSVARSSPVHPVDHWKLTYIPQDVGYMKDPGHSWYAEEFIPATAVPIGPSWDGVMARGVLNPLTDGQLGSYADSALMEFATQVPQEVDVFNFLVDFKEIGSLIPKLQKNLGQTVSGGYLSYQFGWLPMIDDIKKLSNLTTTVASRLAWLRRTRGQRVRLGYFKDCTDDFTSSVNTGLQNLNLDFPSRVFTLRGAKAEFRANGTLYHKLENLDGAEGTLRAMIAALGLNSPSRVAWERVPFSFLVDYFARTQHIAESFTVQPFAGSWNVSNVTSSFKLRFEADVTWKRHSTWLVPIGVLRATRYRRYVGLPVSSSKLLDADLTPQQLAILGALAVGAASK